MSFKESKSTQSDGTASSIRTQPDPASLDSETSADEIEPAPVPQPQQFARIIQRTRLDPGSLSPQNVLQLQGIIGNRAFARLLANRKTSTETPPQSSAITFPDTNSSAASNNAIQRTPSKMKTNGGQFNAKQYHVFETTEATDHIGAGILLQFRPKVFVTGRVGLIQPIKQKAVNPMKVLGCNRPVLF